MSARSILRRVTLGGLLRQPETFSRRTIAAVTSSSSCSSSSNSSGSCRYYASRTAADSHLVELLKSEIENELHEEARKQGSLKGSPGPFELLDKPGTEEVTLSRSFGNEQIAVTCLVESPDEEESEEIESENEDHNEEEADKSAVLHMNIIITKGAEKPALELECSYVHGSNEIEIDSVRYLNEGSKEEAGKPQPYEGPNFDDLDENLQRAFNDLIKARGLSPRVAAYVLEYMGAKEQREYMRWLHSVETFFSS